MECKGICHNININLVSMEVPYQRPEIIFRVRFGDVGVAVTLSYLVSHNIDGLKCAL